MYWSSKSFYPIDTVYFVDAESSDLYLFYALKHMHFISTDVAVPGLNRDFAYSRPLLVPPKSILRGFLEATATSRTGRNAGRNEPEAPRRPRPVTAARDERPDLCMSVPGKKVVIIAGPNGAGKTTFAVEFLPNEAGCPLFVNADLIAGGLSPFAPEKAAVRAGRIMLREIALHVQRGDTFAFETTLSGLAYARRIPQWRSAGHTVKLIFLKLSTVEEALARVAMRVRQGGHNVPAEVVRRRFHSGWRHFEGIYRHRVHYWQCFDNSGPTPVLLSEGANP